MFSQNNDTKKNSFEKRKQYGSLLKKNVSAGNINLKKDQTLQEPKEKDLLKIIKDVQNNVSFLQREMPKTEREYTKFCNEIQIEKQKLAEQNKKLNSQLNNINKRQKCFIESIVDLQQQISGLNFQKQELEISLKNTIIKKQEQEKKRQQKIKDKEQELDNKIKELKLLDERENNLFEDDKSKTKTIEENKKLLEYFRNALENNKDKLKKLKKDREIIMQQFERIRQYKIDSYEFILHYTENDDTKNDLFVDIDNKYNPQLEELNEKQNKIDCKIMQVDYDCIQSKNMIEDLIEDSVPILHNIDAIKEQLDHIETEKQNLCNDIDTIKQCIIFSQRQQNKINNEYKKQSKEYLSNVEEIDKILTEKQTMLNRLDTQYIRFCKINGIRLQTLQQKILNNNTQITKLDEEIKEKTKNYNNIKKAYNRAFGLYQNKQKPLNNKMIIMKKKDLLKK